MAKPHRGYDFPSTTMVCLSSMIGNLAIKNRSQVGHCFNVKGPATPTISFVMLCKAIYLEDGSSKRSSPQTGVLSRKVPCSLKSSVLFNGCNRHTTPEGESWIFTNIPSIPDWFLMVVAISPKVAINVGSSHTPVIFRFQVVVFKGSDDPPCASTSPI